MKKYIKKILNRSERGQAIILVALALVGLVAMVGLVTDTGLLLINYGRLKRGVDAAAVAAAQQYRIQSNGTEPDYVALANTAKNFLDLNQAQNVTIDFIGTCKATDPNRPDLCNPIGGDEKNNRKLVEVQASSVVNFSFMSVIGFKSATITANSIGEAAAMDIVLVIDTSLSMAYETGAELGGTSYTTSDSDDDPSQCNPNACQPMQAIKETAKKFINTLYFPYDRVAIVTMTHQTPGDNFANAYNTVRAPEIILSLSTNKTAIENKIDGIKVFQPRDCEPNTNPGFVAKPGICLSYKDSNTSWDNTTRIFTSRADYNNPYCQIFEFYSGNHDADYSSCPSSNIGGALKLAQLALTGNGDPTQKKLDAFWVVVAILSGPANATNTPAVDATVSSSYPNGYCPRYTTVPGVSPRCRDKYPWVRHAASAEASWTNPNLIDPSLPDDPSNHYTYTLLPDTSLYDADDYARDQADSLATLLSGDGVTVYTIGLGQQVQNTDTVAVAIPPNPPAAEALLRYIAECAGEGDADDCYTPVLNPVINHGQYFYSPNTAGLTKIFTLIANNIATKISE